MSQQEVYDFLKSNDGWWTARQISDSLGSSLCSVTCNLKKLRKEPYIAYRQILFRESAKRKYYEYTHSEENDV